MSRSQDPKEKKVPSMQDPLRKAQIIPWFKLKPELAKAFLGGREKRGT